jgi:predicted permease
MINFMQTLEGLAIVITLALVSIIAVFFVTWVITDHPTRWETGQATKRGSLFHFVGVSPDQLLQYVIVVAFGALCFGCGYLAAFFVTRNHWRDEMIRRGHARYNWTAVSCLNSKEHW